MRAAPVAYSSHCGSRWLLLGKRNAVYFGERGRAAHHLIQSGGPQVIEAMLSRLRGKLEAIARQEGDARHLWRHRYYFVDAHAASVAVSAFAATFGARLKDVEPVIHVALREALP